VRCFVSGPSIPGKNRDHLGGALSGAPPYGGSPLRPNNNPSKFPPSSKNPKLKPVRTKITAPFNKFKPWPCPWQARIFQRMQHPTANWWGGAAPRSESSPRSSYQSRGRCANLRGRRAGPGLGESLAGDVWPEKPHALWTPPPRRESATYTYRSSRKFPRNKSGHRHMNMIAYWHNRIGFRRPRRPAPNGQQEKKKKNRPPSRPSAKNPYLFSNVLLPAVPGDVCALYYRMLMEESGVTPSFHTHARPVTTHPRSRSRTHRDLLPGGPAPPELGPNAFSCATPHAWEQPRTTPSNEATRASCRFFRVLPRTGALAAPAALNPLAYNNAGLEPPTRNNKPRERDPHLTRTPPRTWNRANPSKKFGRRPTARLDGVGFCEKNAGPAAGRNRRACCACVASLPVFRIYMDMQ